MKRFSTVGDTQKCSQSYKEKRRERRVIEVTRWRRGGIKRGEHKVASSEFTISCPQSGPLREIH